MRTRFEQPDPWDGSYNLANPQSFNLYSYVRNDPVNQTDPSGLVDNWVFCDAQYGSCSGQGQGYGSNPFDYSYFRSAWGDANVSENIARGIMRYEAWKAQKLAEARKKAEDERAHSAVRCPPTKERLAKHPAVKKAIKESFKAATDFHNQRGYWVEHGGWIYQNRRTGQITTQPKTPAVSPPLPKDYAYLDSGYGVYLNSPPSMAGYDVVGLFHIHGENTGPNEYDDAAADQNKVPGVLGTPDGNIQTYGNYQSGVFGKGTPKNCK